jgi:hypothetical protein
MNDLPASPQRRRLLIAGSSVAVLGATGAIWIASRLDGRQAWIEAVVREHLPGIQLDSASLAAFAQSFAATRIFADDKNSLAIKIDQAVPALAQQVSKVERRTERLKRRVITEYLTGSNFFRIEDPRKETIVYSGPLPACGNPFAQFRDA